VFLRAVRCLALFVTAGIAMAPLAALGAESDAAVLRIRGQRLAVQGRCEDALPLLERALAASPREARAALLAGQCEIERRRYSLAVTLLEEAKRRDAGLADVDLYLGIARFHQGDLEGAEAALEAASSQAVDRAEYHLYRGLLLLQRLESKQAAMELDRARAADASRVDPVASYYEALAWASTDERAPAREALERVLEQAPESVWAEQARQALQDLEGRERRVWWFNASSGFEYDDNVSLRSEGLNSALLPSEIGRGHDVRGVWRMDSGSEWLRTTKWSAGFVASYSGSAHQDLNEFNDQYPAFSLWLDRYLSESTTARFQYDVGYAWFESRPYVFPQRLTSALYHEWPEHGSTRFFANFDRYNFLYSVEDVPGGTPTGVCPPGFLVCGPAGLDERAERNRDGYGVSVGFEHSVPLGFANTNLRAGYAYHRYSARGREYSSQGHEVSVGARTSLPFRFVLDTQVSGTYQPYRHASSYPDPSDVAALALADGGVYRLASESRRDDVWRVEVGLERPINRFITASVRYRFLQNHSSVDVFDYDREILGAYLTVRFHD
jgi:tetratricopeptide (TPR) repeat protein